MTSVLTTANPLVTTKALKRVNTPAKMRIVGAEKGDWKDFSLDGAFRGEQE
jgi:hypothetical protein